MHTDAEHLHQSRHNRRFTDFVANSAPQFADWVITGLFYCALHQVERYAFAKLRRHNKGHKARCQFVWLSLRQIFHSYRKLQDMSEDVRYECYSPTAADIATAEQFARQVQNHTDQSLV